MSKAKHTPGPWMTLPGKPPTFFYAPVAGGREMHLVGRAGEGSPKTFEEALANCNLMLAAPDMYEALCELIVAYDMPNYGDPETTMDNMESVMPAIRAAIAKARGGE